MSSNDIIVCWSIKKLFFLFPYTKQFLIRKVYVKKIRKIRFIYLSATIKWRKYILALHNWTTAPTIPSFTALQSHAILRVTFTLVIPIQRLIMTQYLLQWLFFKVFYHKKRNSKMHYGYGQLKGVINLQRIFISYNWKI